MVHLHLRPRLCHLLRQFLRRALAPDAQPEIQELARQMFSALHSNTRARLSDQWHLPYVSADEEQSLGLDTARRCSAARCARVSISTTTAPPPTSPRT